MTESKQDNVTTLVPESREPPYPANLFAIRWYGGFRIFAMTVLMISVINLGETCWSTTFRRGDFSGEAKAILDLRGALSRCKDNMIWFWLERAPEQVLVQRKAAALISRRRCLGLAGVGLAWFLVWLTFRHRHCET